MTPDEYTKFRHNAVHDLIRLNKSCEMQFQISNWPQWRYDFDLGTSSFIKDGRTRVIASIQVVGTTSGKAGTWLWSWANESIPENVMHQMKMVRQFGEEERLTELTQPSCVCDEDFGWQMSAIAAKVLSGQGAYRCPAQDRFMYVVYTDIAFAEPALETIPPEDRVQCGDHGPGYKTYLCEHLLEKPTRRWFSDLVSCENRWPDSWCEQCDAAFQEQGERNAQNESKLKIKLVCHRCYEQLRQRSVPHS